MTPKPITKRLRIDDGTFCTPLWNKERGRRLRTVRIWKMHWKLSDMAPLLGISISNLSRIELGQILASPLFTMAHLKALVGPHMGFIFMGVKPEDYLVKHSTKFKSMDRFGQPRSRLKRKLMSTQQD